MLYGVETPRKIQGLDVSGDTQLYREIRKAGNLNSS